MTEFTKAAVQKALTPYHSLIRRIVDEAWAEYRQIVAMRSGATMAPLLYSRTAANYVFDAIARRAIPAFGDEAGARLKIEAQTFKVLLGGVVLRFKKGGEDKLGSNIPTFAALAFTDPDKGLPGFSEHCPKVEVIWRPNDIDTALDAVLIVARDGDRLLWEYEIHAPPSTEILPMPMTPRDPSDESAADLVKPKRNPAAANEKQ